jgi:methanogenic corrinoid protein MtbC1
MKMSEIQHKLRNEIKEDWQLSEAAVRLFRETMPSILALVNEKFRLGKPNNDNRAILQNLDFLMDAHRHFGEMLLAIYQFQLWHSFIDEAIWYAQSARSRGLDERYFSQMLRTWMIALHSYIKSPEVGELTQPLIWLSKYSQDLFQSSVQEEVLSDEASELLNLLLGNERGRAEKLANSFSREKNSDEALIDKLLLPVLSEIGRLWRDNQISVADEHLAVANLRSIYQVHFRSRPSEELRKQRVTVCCVPGEEHEIGAELLSLYLGSRGWPIDFIGHSTPEDEILRMVRQNAPFALVLSGMLISHLPALVSLLQRLRESSPSLKILAGGSAIRQAKEVIKGLADGIPDSFEECHKMLSDMVNAHA